MGISLTVDYISRFPNTWGTKIWAALLSMVFLSSFQNIKRQKKRKQTNGNKRYVSYFKREALTSTSLDFLLLSPTKIIFFLKNVG